MLQLMLFAVISLIFCALENSAGNQSAIRCAAVFVSGISSAIERNTSSCTVCILPGNSQTGWRKEGRLITNKSNDLLFVHALRNSVVFCAVNAVTMRANGASCQTITSAATATASSQCERSTHRQSG